MIAKAESAQPDVRDTVAVALGAAGLFLLAWAALHVSFYANIQIVDTPVYETYGEAMVDGDVPYRDFKVEYPPLALPVFLLPAIGDGDYREQFEWLMAFCGCVTLFFVALSLRVLRLGIATLAFVALAPLAIGTVVLSRFDLWPTALVAAALAATSASSPSSRPRRTATRASSRRRSRRRTSPRSSRAGRGSPSAACSRARSRS